MGRAKATATSESTALVDWEAQMAEQAELAAATQRSTGGGGKFISTKSGVLSYDGEALPGNQMAVIILADVLENSFYDAKYDPDNKASPVCFAFAKDEDDLEPHSAVDNDAYFKRQNNVCNGCPRNEWGSAETGKGKACKNVQRLALIPAGAYRQQGKGRNSGLELELFDDPAHFAKAEVAYLKLPVMSVKNYAAFVKGTAAELRRPPHGVICNLYLEPDPKSQFKVMFEVIDKVPSDLLEVVMKRHNLEKESIAFPYSPPPEEDRAAATTTVSNNKLRKAGAPKKGGR